MYIQSIKQRKLYIYLFDDTLESYCPYNVNITSTASVNTKFKKMSPHTDGKSRGNHQLSDAFTFIVGILKVSDLNNQISVYLFHATP